MISLSHLFEEGFMDKVHTKIDNTLQKTAPGRLYMKAEDKTGELINKGANALSNTVNRLRGKNFKVRK